MKKIIVLILLVGLLVTMAACAGATAETGTTEATITSTGVSGTQTATTTGSGQQTSSSGYVPVEVEYDEEDLDDSWDESKSTIVTLDGDNIDIDGTGANVEDNRVAIYTSGTYVISGILDDGQIVVNSVDDGLVKIVLNGVDISSLTSSPLYIVAAEKVVITLAEGTVNFLADGTEYVYADEESQEPNAALFSKADLTINGKGSLTVAASFNNGIQSKDDLIITGGTILVTAVNDGLKGKDCVVIKDGSITVEAEGDGIISTNSGDGDKGYIAIEGGTLDIDAGLDGIQAETSVLVAGGDIIVSCGGGSVNSSSKGETWGDWGRPGTQQQTATTDENTESAKGLKAAINITIIDGTITIDSSDDVIHSNDSITVNGGEIIVASGDDGIHADATLDIDGGNIIISKSYEGIESAIITINGGSLDIVASDDAINVAGGNDGSSIDGRSGQNMFQSSESNYLYINGGYIVVDFGGDGIDVNGSVTMTDGTVIVNGPTNNGNGPLDYLGTFNINGGFLVAAGSSGMAMSLSAVSTQCSVLVVFPSVLSAGTMVSIQSESGEEILTFVPAKTFQSVVVATPELETGGTYTVFTGGSSTGTATDGLFDGGSYSGGSEYTSFIMSGTATSVGSGGGMPAGDMPGGGMRR